MSTIISICMYWYGILGETSETIKIQSHEQCIILWNLYVLKYFIDGNGMEIRVNVTFASPEKSTLHCKKKFLQLKGVYVGFYLKKSLR